jgi:hypothetical protein
VSYRFPNRRTLRLLLVSTGFLLLVIVLAWFLFEPVRHFIAVPMEFMAWILKTLYLLVPRYAWWIIFLVLAYIIALNGLTGKTSRFHWSSSHSEEMFAEPKVARIARYVRLRGNPFYHHRLNHLVTELALRVLAYQQQGSLQQTRMALNHGPVGLPQGIEKFLRAGLPPWPDMPFPSPGLLNMLFPSRREKRKPDVEAEQVLDFLEDALEVPRDH